MGGGATAVGDSRKWIWSQYDIEIANSSMVSQIEDDIEVSSFHAHHTDVV